MNYPYRINYSKSGIAESIEYTISKANSKGAEMKKQSSLDLLCDIVNSTDPYHLYYLYTNSGRTSDANDLLDFATAFINEYKEKTYYPIQINVWSCIHHIYQFVRRYIPQTFPALFAFHDGNHILTMISCPISDKCLVVVGS